MVPANMFDQIKQLVLEWMREIGDGIFGLQSHDGMLLLLLLLLLCVLMFEPLPSRSQMTRQFLHGSTSSFSLAILGCARFITCSSCTQVTLFEFFGKLIIDFRQCFIFCE